MGKSKKYAMLSLTLGYAVLLLPSPRVVWLEALWYALGSIIVSGSALLITIRAGG